MAPYTPVPSSTPLRVVTQRLTTTPTRQLPHVASYLAASISECKEVFEYSQGDSRDASETGVIIHKLKTQLSALLQDRSTEARFSAVILIKVVVEVGGWSILQKVGPWVRELIAIIGRPDPSATKRLCIVTLTRIFLLTHDHQSLTREVTTPSLAAFIAACLTWAKRPSPSLTSQNTSILTVLQAFTELITLHPSSFRPFVQQIQTLVLPLIAPTPSDMGSVDQRCTISRLFSDTARRLFVLLHVCAPKNTAGEEWARSLRMIIVSAQRTADRIFRSLIEDWRPRLDRVDVVGLAMSEIVSDGKPQPLSLPGWTGIYDGVQRLDGLLCTVQAFISSTSSTAVVLQVSSIMNLTDRILSILQPSGARGSRIRPEIGRDEREGLGVGLAQLHISAMAILSLMISRLGSGYAATKERTLEQVLWVLQNECANDEVRRAAYGVVSQILMKFGLSLPVSCAVPISLCIRACCEDLVSLEEALAQGREGPALNGTRRPDTNANSFLKSAKTPLNNVTASEPTIEAAEWLLPLALTNLPSGFLSHALRARIDKTAILAGNKNAMLASVMNPHGRIKGKQSSISILPLLARAHFGALDVESLLRPQMPTVQSRRMHDGDGRLEEEEEEQAYEPGFQDALRPDSFGFSSNYSSDRIAEREGSRALASDDPHEAQEISMTATGGADSAQPGIDMLKSQASPMLGKRNREIEIPLEAETGIDDASIATKTIQSEEETSIKRARLTISEPEQNQEKEISLDDIVLDGPSTRSIATPEPSMTQTTEGAGAKFPDDPVDSDESDFEMPTLYLGPDTDEEDEGEEEDDE